jgi:hypothetical protein
MKTLCSRITTFALAGGHARPYKIYVGNIGDNTITTYDANATQTNPTIKTGTSSTDHLFGMAVGPSGKIYALNFDPLLGMNATGTVTTYKPDGTQTTRQNGKRTTPTIGAGLDEPSAIALH